MYFGLVLFIMTIIGFGLCQFYIQKMVEAYTVQLGEWIKNDVNHCISVKIATGKSPLDFSDAHAITSPEGLLQAINEEYPCEKGEHNVTLYLNGGYYFVPFANGVIGCEKSSFPYNVFLNFFSRLGLISGTTLSLLMIWKTRINRLIKNLQV